MRIPIPNVAPPDDYLTMIGYICAWWQQIEHLIDVAIWDWAGLSRKRGRCFTAHMTFPLKCDVLRSLVNAKFNDPIYDKELHKFIEKELKPTQSIRNRFAHALWVEDKDETFWLAEKPNRTRHNVEYVRADFDELLAAHGKIFQMWANLYKIIGGFDCGDFSQETWRKRSISGDSLYDQMIATRSRYRVMRDKRLHPPQSSRA